MNLDENLLKEENELKLTDRDIFTKIWTSPRLVFKFLNDNRYDKYVHILLVFAGISRTFDRASTKNMGDDMSLLAVLVLCIILGGLLGWISYYIYAALMSWTGKWLKGQGDTNSLLRMISHAMIPSIVALALLIPQIVLFGNGIFRSDIDIYSSGLLSIIVFYTALIIEFGLGIWTLVIFIIGISEVQKLSIGKSILNLILPALIIIVPIAMIAFLLGDLFG